jgi:hypothetical protein
MKIFFLVILFYGQGAVGSKNPEDTESEKQRSSRILSKVHGPAAPLHLRKSNLNSPDINELIRSKGYNPPKVQASLLTWFRHWARRMPK